MGGGGERDEMFYDRKSPRLKHFDYATPTMYFVTICTHGMVCLFGQPDALNELGHTVRACIEQIPFHYDCATVEKYVVMPNHVHMLILLTGENCPALSTIIGSYKSNVSKQIHLINPAVHVWQRSFHDHIVRSENTLERIWKYIDENPYHWNEDKFFVNDL